ncbi:MAG: hypothetical protein KDA37_09835, partial [Planctomycetales bacterium]|nr:hypothetical protein [Planctomycetales bacterium]
AEPMEEDGLFGEEPAEEAPAEETPAEPADDFGGLFNDSEPAEEAPAVEDQPAMDEGDDLGGLFGEESAPAEETPSEEAPADEPEDDFGGLFDESAPAEEPAEEQPAEEEGGTSFDDLFESSQVILEQPGGIASLEMRTWVDNTGLYRTRGRLLAVVDGAVRLMKQNGRISTVPFERLSSTDLGFVNRQASAERNLKVAQTAQR